MFAISSILLPFSCFPPSTHQSKSKMQDSPFIELGSFKHLAQNLRLKVGSIWGSVHNATLRCFYVKYIYVFVCFCYVSQLALNFYVLCFVFCYVSAVCSLFYVLCFVFCMFLLCLAVCSVFYVFWCVLCFCYVLHFALYFMFLVYLYVLFPVCFTVCSLFDILCLVLCFASVMFLLKI